MQKNPIFYIILRRTRFPLILLVVAYSVAVTGLTLIPGVDADGNESYFTFFHSFYFFSYVATTIGFGEIPHSFTDQQRLWVVFCIYLTVISWLLSIGQILAMVSDPMFKQALARQKFAKKVRQINKKFFIICGYGETGELLVKQLISKGHSCVVIENNSDRANLLDIDSSTLNIPHISGDAGDVEILKISGITNPFCKALIAVTNNDAVNVKIAVAAKLLQRDVKVVCKTTSKESMANAKSFDTDIVVNPYITFSENISLAIRNPNIQQLLATLYSQPGSEFPDILEIKKGNWIICGYDHFGQEVSRFLDYEGINFTIIDNEFTETSSQKIKGKGTEATALRASGLDKCCGVIAATDNDADNLSIIMTARNLKPEIYLIARQNQDSNRSIFQAAKIDLVMESARLLISQILPLLTQPYLSRFLKLAKHQDDKWGEEQVKRIKSISQKVPATYVVKINTKHAPAAISLIKTGNILRLQDILRNPKNIDTTLPVIALMLIRDDTEIILPSIATALKSGDIILLASDEMTREQIFFAAHSDQELYYLTNGKEKPISIVLSMINNKWKSYKRKKATK